MKNPRIFFGTVGGMFIQQPPESFQGFAIIDRGFSPLLFANFVNGFVECFYDMEPIQYQGGLRTMALDSCDIGLAHVTGSPSNFAFLIIAKHFVKETIDAIRAFTFTNPYDTGLVSVINDRGVFMVLSVGYFINTNGSKVANTMSVADPLNATMQLIRKSGLGNMQQLSGGFLSHYLTIDKHGIFKPICNP
jgi:hypothetical protein